MSKPSRLGLTRTTSLLLVSTIRPCSMSASAAATRNNMSNSPTTTSTSQQALQAMAQQTLGQLPDIMRQAMEGHHGRPSDELGAGITSGFAIVSLRGKVWRIKHRGEERNLVARDPQGHD